MPNLTSPRDNHGRFFSRSCPECCDSTLQPIPDTLGGGHITWHCDGLVDPEFPAVES